MSGRLAEQDSLLDSPILLLILQPLGYTDVVLHQLVLLDVCGVVLFNYERKDSVYSFLQTPAPSQQHQNH